MMKMKEIDKMIDLTFEQLREEYLEEVAQLYDAERPMNTNRIKMKQTFHKIKDNQNYQMIVVKHNDRITNPRGNILCKEGRRKIRENYWCIIAS